MFLAPSLYDAADMRRLVPQNPPAAAQCGRLCAHLLSCLRAQQGRNQSRIDGKHQEMLVLGSTSAWNPVKGLGAREDWGCVEVGEQQDDGEEQRRGVDHHQQQLGMGWTVPPTMCTTKNQIELYTN